MHKKRLTCSNNIHHKLFVRLSGFLEDFPVWRRITQLRLETLEFILFIFLLQSLAALNGNSKGRVELMTRIYSSLRNTRIIIIFILLTRLVWTIKYAYKWKYKSMQTIAWQLSAFHVSDKILASKYKFKYERTSSSRADTLISRLVLINQRLLSSWEQLFVVIGS